MGGDSFTASRGTVRQVGDVIFDADQHVARWVAARIPGYTQSQAARALGVIKNDRLVAGVVYENFNGVHVEAAIAAEPGTAWASRQTLHSLFYYPFTMLGCEAISVSVPSTNLESLNLATKLGFEPEAIVALAAHDQSSLIVLKAWRIKCKWIEHGQEGRKRTSDS